MRETLRLVAYNSRFQGIGFEPQLAADLKLAFADNNEIQQVLINLIFNAADASQHRGGTIRVVTENHPARDNAGRVKKVLMRVVDNGIGIPPEHLSRVFDPFFTTKPAGAGVGLGLSLCQRIILANLGTIRIDSEIGKGTAVTICLPITNAEAAAADAAGIMNETEPLIPERLAGQSAPVPEPQRGPYHVLVVEDEDLMRSIIAQLLRSEGYTVFEAHAAEAALGIFEREKIDLAIIDVNLGGGGSGLDLLSRVRALDSEVMGIIVTAYPSVESAVHALHEGAYDYITKPFANDHLKAVVRNALAQKALFQENRFLRRELREKYRFENIIGKSDADRAGLPHHGEGRAHRLQRAHHRRVGHRQGAGGARDPFQFRARPRALRADQLRRDAREPARERALRLQARRLHRRRAGQAGPAQSGRQGHRCCSTRSARCRSRCRSSCCARSRSANAIRWAPTTR